MLTLSEVEAEVQFLADESNLVLSSGAGLAIFNSYYKLFSGLRRWGELEITDSSIVTVAGQEAYRWPITRTFIIEPAILLQRTAGNTNNFVQVWPVTDNIHWGCLANVTQSFPSHYKRESKGANDFTLLFRPFPNTADLQVRIVGQAEPIKLVQAADRTVFRESKTDLALARYIAAQYQKKRDNPGRAEELLDEMRDMLPESDYMPTPRPTDIIPWLT